MDNRLNPSWVHTRLAALVQHQEKGQSIFSKPEISCRAARMEQLWQEFFSDPSQWWDNRFIKKSPKYPDFKHKTRNEGLWMDGLLNPPWVRTKMATMAMGRRQSGGGLSSRVPNSFGNGDNACKLCQEGRLNEALHMVELMVQQDTQVPIIVYVGLMKGFARRKALAEGKRVHALIVQSGIASDIFLGNILVDLYVKCGSVLDAWKVFNAMPEHNVCSWTTIISAYVDHGQYEQAINLFQQMLQTGVAPDKVAFVVVLKACARIAALEEGKQLHSQIIKSGFESDVIVGSVLVDMYAKCSCIEHARQVFNNMHERDVMSWTTMIAGYAQQGLGNEALTLYEQMKQEGVQPVDVTYVLLLKACASIAALEQGKQFHSHIKESGFQSNLIVGNALVDMYAKCGSIEHACQVFNNMHERDVVTWNAMITGYAQQGLGKEALTLFERMKQEGLQPDAVTYVVLLKACASISFLEQGKQLHYQIIRSGFESFLIVGNTLVEMYVRCGKIEDARQVFTNMHERNLVSWTLMIAGYTQQGLGKEALALYEQMKEEGVQPDDVMYVVLLKACASIAALEQGKQLHSLIIRGGFQLHVIIGNTLVDMYAKCWSIKDARQVFNGMHERNVVSWTAMLAGYVQQGLGQEALALYEQMKQEGVQADIATYVVLLKACASISALEQGKQFHSHIIESGFESDLIVGNTLVDMYAKCGSIECAREVFNNMHERDVVSWNAIISGYAQEGLGKEALTLLEGMQREGKKPNEVTYASVLSACSHSGLVEEGCHLFHSMCNDHAVTPTVDHYACMVDLLGRAGCLADAEDFINKMPIQPDAVVWKTLLGAARNRGHVEIGRHAFDQVMRLEPENTGAYVLLSNILSNSWQEV
ncbi:hypothetical protein O6H91_13G058400 [Diphasiastrum complanatum]|nr:hypothetical protein O6H91_Y278900 [Diphasiastrum complanatum]KAJ7533646.1 hypothetical protein O6H91_13G058400 [Diphasiastrum complanatum]KAJ7533647.1 hypothetical protein O6H91_13G058400 [Diphasiastrum complanatum]